MSPVVLLGLRGLRLGPLRLTAYGACAAAGVVAAMTLSGRAARRQGLSAEATWDAGLLAVVCCFGASRLLLVLSDPRAFALYPLAVLGLPSLTFGGMALAAVPVWLYLRRRRLPMLRTLDGFAPGGALLAAFLELGHWMEGSDPAVRWGPDPFGEALTPYSLSPWGMVISVGIGVGLWRALGGHLRAGKVAALGLMLGGLAAYGLAMLSLPAAMFSAWPLEPGECVSLAAMLSGAILWTFGLPDSLEMRRAGAAESAPSVQGEAR